MFFAWVIIGIILLVLMFAAQGALDGCLQLPVAIGMWFVIGILMFIVWLVFSADGEPEDCLNWNIDTVSCDD